MTVGLRYLVSPSEQLASAPVSYTHTEVPPTTRRRSLSAGVSYLLAGVAAALTAFVLQDQGPVVWYSAAAVAVVLALELETLPSYARATSLRAAKHLLAGGGAVLLAGTVTDVLEPRQVRASLLVATAASAVVVAAAALRRLTRGPRTTLLVGDAQGVGDLISQWGSRPEIDVRGVCLAQRADEPRIAQVLGERVCGDVSSVPEVAAALGVDTVVVAPGPVLSAYDVRRLSWALDGSPAELTVASEIHGATPHRVAPQVLGRRLLLSVRPGTRPGPALLVKNAIDRIGAALLLVLLAPVLVAVAVLVRRDSRGPILFAQERTGVNDSRFQMLKFRTMCVDAESKLEDLQNRNEGSGPLFKISDDPRVTRIGRILRKTSLDELPQLVNVLKGEMSLIGPRPGLPSETATYDDWERRRLSVKPGMTGAWQVSGRSGLSWQDSVWLDMDYVDNGTLTYDFAIAVRTAGAVLGRYGAS